ncbi:MAG: DUF4070 domain-containing protein [Methyloprofundus sp.]|nr:DUF4070 domain-containing protein [Methyloprofundus sp.]
MRALLIYPILPPHILSFKKTMTRLDKKSSYPPVGLMTVAALLPSTWEIKLVDANIREVTDDDWLWAEIVLISAMIPQKQDFHQHIKQAKRHHKTVVIGGPYPTALPEEAASSGADYLVLNEGEITIPLFLQGLENGDLQGIYQSSQKPDVTKTPLPRYDLIDFKDYSSLSIQYSRGCPFLCEFCDIITLYGRKPRVKTPEQMMAEFDLIYNLGWRGVVSVIDDNFIGNKRQVKSFLLLLKQWMLDKQYPFALITEASLDLALEQELMDLMIECNFKGLFVGIETPDEESLLLTKKSQNTHIPITESIDTLYKTGFTLIAGMIIGFDGEKQGAGERIRQFLEITHIPIANFGILQALPTTALWDRLEQEQRLLSDTGDGMATKPMNFKPSRPAEQIISEYIDANWQLYEPEAYLKRLYTHCLAVTIVQNGAWKELSPAEKKRRLAPLNKRSLYFLLSIFGRYGFISEARLDFWGYLFKLAFQKPVAVLPFLINCAFLEDLEAYRQFIRQQMQSFT